MKVLGRMVIVDGEGHVENGHAFGNDLIVQMSPDEWELWREITGPRPGGDFTITKMDSWAFKGVKDAVKAAADAMGLDLVAKPTIVSQGRACQFENCKSIADRINGAGDYLCGAHT